MSTHAPVSTEYIEIREVGRSGTKVAHIIGSPLTVGEVAHMYLYQDSDVEWLIENFDDLTPAKIHAAIAYYYDHQAEIDDYLRRQSEAAEAQADALLSDVIARMKARLKPE